VNEGAKTGIYWIGAVAMLAIALFVSRAPETENPTRDIVGQPLFPTFTDPLAASTLRIVTFNEEQGELAKFEVAKDEQTGVWSLPSRNNYPADAAEQMKNAANALVGVKILDIQTENPEDHSKLGVLEPNADSLQAGDEGVGRLVTLKGQNNSTLASIIIGNVVKGNEKERYARVPGQDPVYRISLDDKPLSTKFEDWIEKDLLQLSSIDIADVEIQNYDAALELGNQLALNRSFDAKLSIDGSNAWQLDSLVVYDDQGEKKETKLGEDEKLATTKLNSLKNALDDLKIVDVAAKPKGMSENLKADKDLVSDQQAVLSLAGRGFFPVTQGDILSANGEMVVTLKDGVQYVLRFGNVEGIDESKSEDAKEGAEGEPAKPATAGANRYLLVTARVDESKFPPPELASIPKTIEELEAAEAAKAPATEPATEPAAETPAEADKPADDAAAPEEPAATEEMKKEGDAAEAKPEDAKPEEPAAETSEAAPAEAEKPAEEPAATDSPEPAEGVTEQEGSGAATGTGQGQDPAQESAEEATTEAEAPAAPAADEAATEEKPADAPESGEKAADAEPATETPASEAKADEKAMPAEAAPAAEDTVETAEEKQERLEAEQEKITKENQRKLDERKDKLEAARRKVRELNGRFAEWYYVIPEATYRDLRLSREELIEKPAAATAPGAPADDASLPPVNIPGLGQ
jgi:hypothetical protein